MSSTSILVALSAIAAVAVALGYSVNLLARRPLLNPWLLGLGALALAGAANLWLLLRIDFFDTDDAFRQGQRFGQYAAGPVAIPLLFLVWQARRFNRREKGPDALKGSFASAVGVTLAFVVVSALVSAVVSPLITRSSAERAARHETAVARARAEALVRVASQASATLPTVVDSETVLFRVEAKGGRLIYHYRMIHLLKTDVAPGALAGFQVSIVQESCSKQATRDQFLRQGVVLEHNYYDKDDQLITTAEVSTDSCAALAK